MEMVCDERGIYDRKTIGELFDLTIQAKKFPYTPSKTFKHMEWQGVVPIHPTRVQETLNKSIFLQKQP